MYYKMYNVVYWQCMCFLTELDSQLQPISNGGRTKKKRPNKKRGRTSSSGWSMIQSFDIVHIHIRGDNRGRVEITHTFYSDILSV